MDSIFKTLKYLPVYMASFAIAVVVFSIESAVADSSCRTGLLYLGSNRGLSEEQIAEKLVTASLKNQIESPDLAEKLKSQRIPVKPVQSRRSKPVAIEEEPESIDGIKTQNQFFAERNPERRLLTAEEERIKIQALEALEKQALRELLVKDAKLVEVLEARLREIESGDLNALSVMFHFSNAELKDAEFLDQQIKKLRSAVDYLKLSSKDQDPRVLEAHLDFLSSMTRAYYNRVYLSRVLSSAESPENLELSPDFEIQKLAWQKQREEFLDLNYGLALSLGRQWRAKNLESEDRVSEAAIELIQAVDAFEPRQGFKFSTFYFRIGGHRLSKKDFRFRPIKWIPHTPKELREFIEDFFKQNAFYPTVEEVMLLAGASMKQAEAALLQVRHPRTLIPETDLKKNQDGRTQPIRVSRDIRPDERVARAERSELDQIHGFVEQVLSDRERAVIEFRFGLNGRSLKTLQQVGDELGFNRERARQIEAEALLKLRIAIFVAQSELSEYDAAVQIAYARHGIKTEKMSWRDIGIGLDLSEEQVKEIYESFVQKVNSEIPALQ